MKKLTNDYYHALKPFIPRSLQIYLRRKIVWFKLQKCRHEWPIDETAGTPPAGWGGWPEGKKFALVLTHDVDTARGHERCRELMELEEGLGFRSSFNFVPLRYEVSPALRQALMVRGFEVGVHGLYHDGKYYLSREQFEERARQINRYLKEWKCAGYRAPCMFHKLEWFHDLDIEYDASTFDTDPFEPYSEGVKTIFPFIVACGYRRTKYVELPYTLPQDFTLFVLMQMKNIDTWKRKLDWIVQNGGLVLMNTHPDYMNFNGSKCGNEEYPVQYYREFLDHVRSAYAGQYWHVLPRDLARFWKQESQTCSLPEKTVRSRVAK